MTYDGKTRVDTREIHTSANSAEQSLAGLRGDARESACVMSIAIEYLRRHPGLTSVPSNAGAGHIRASANVVRLRT